MGFLSTIKRNSRAISDHTAGTQYYFELATTNLALYRALREAASQYVKGRCLDAGAGRMAYRRVLEEFCETYESLDIEPRDGITHVADLEETGLPDEQYDSIFCTQVLHHVRDPRRALVEMARCLKPGGRLILTVPHLSWLHNEPHDYWRFTVHGIRHLLRQAGLEEIRIEPLGGLISFLAYAPSTVALAVLWQVRPLFRAGLALNRIFIRFALLLDRAFGARSLYPVNYLCIARRPLPRA